MNRIKSYLVMRYEMFLANLFDFIIKRLRKTRLDWYPENALGLDKEGEYWFEAWLEETEKVDELFEKWMDKCDKVYELESKILELEGLGYYLNDYPDEEED